MKNILYILLTVALIFVSCKSENNNIEENKSKQYSADDGYITMKGGFLYYDDAAVLETKSEIFGVVLDDNLQELVKQVKPFQKEITDMVPVTIRVKKIPKPQNEEGWPFRLEIKEILKIDQPRNQKNDVIKLSK